MDRLPMSQYVISGSLLSGSATYFVNVMNDENSVDTIMPPSTSMRMASLPRLTRWHTK